MQLTLRWCYCDLSLSVLANLWLHMRLKSFDSSIEKQLRHSLEALGRGDFLKIFLKIQVENIETNIS
jgi:hypothetical protein